MHFVFNILIFIISLVLMTRTNSEIIKKCSYEYTVDLTTSQKLPNNSYLFNNDTLITPDLVQDYDFKILHNGTRIDDVEPYKRGCICAVKKCMMFCFNKFIEFYHKKSTPEMDKKFTKNITLANGKLIEKHLIHDFYPTVSEMICRSTNFRILIPEVFPKQNWTLFEDGILLRHSRNTNLTQDEYCFDGNILNGSLTVNPVFCAKPLHIPWYSRTALVASIPFFILIILIYSFSSNVKTVRGKCFITYLSLLSLTYTLISVYNRNFEGLAGVPCHIYGYVRYYIQMGCYSWSCILCYDVWNCLTHMVSEQSSFRKYFIIGFSIPSLMTLIAFIKTHFFSKMPKLWLCTLFDPNPTIVHIFFDLPAIIVVTYTWTSYILIILYSRKTKKEQAAYFHEIQRPKLERLMVYIRILISMGCEWTILFGLYMLRRLYEHNYQVLDYILRVDKFITTFQGLFVFLIFIWDSRVRNGIRKRSSKISSAIRRKLRRNRATTEEYSLSATH